MGSGEVIDRRSGQSRGLDRGRHAGKRRPYDAMDGVGLALAPRRGYKVNHRREDHRL